MPRRTIALRRRGPPLGAGQSLIVPIPKSRWAPPARAIVLGGRKFEPKRELHVTLLGSAAIAAVHAAIDAGHFELSDLAQAYAAQSWVLTRGEEWRRIGRTRVERGVQRHAETVIECVALPALRGFVESVSAKLGVALPIPPAHVTLYTAGQRRGIGVADDAALARMTLERYARDPADCSATSFSTSSP